MYKLCVVFLILMFIAGCGDNKGDGTPGGGKGNTGSVNPEGQASSDHWIHSVSFVRIKAGSFTMGSPAMNIGIPARSEQVSVEIKKSFGIMEKEVTQRQWFLVKKENPSEFKEPENCDDHEVIDGVGMCPNHPVDSVSWDDVQEYI